jgi:hypothetical protein
MNIKLRNLLCFRHRLLALPISLAFLAVCSLSAFGASGAWLGSVSNWWVDNPNWTGGSSPTTPDTATIGPPIGFYPPTVIDYRFQTVTISKLVLSDEASRLNITENGRLTVTDEIVNFGQINLVDNGTHPKGALYVGPSTELSGGGRINLINDGYIKASASDSLLINNDNTIAGSGFIFTPFENNHLISAEGPPGFGIGIDYESPPILDAKTSTNLGIMRSTGTGVILSSFIDILNHGGLIEAVNNSRVVIYSGSVEGGELRSDATSKIQAGNLHFSPSRLRDIEILPGTVVEVVGLRIGIATTFEGNIDNSGSIIADPSTTPWTSIKGPVLLTGGGTVELGLVLGEGADDILANEDNLIAGGNFSGGNTGLLQVVNSGNFSNSTFSNVKRLSNSEGTIAWRTGGGISAVEVFNAGLLDIGIEGVNNLNARLFVQNETGRTSFDLGGTTTGAEYKQFNCQTIYLEGVIEVDFEYAPQLGDRFRLFTFNNLQLNEATVNAIDLPTGYSLVSTTLNGAFEVVVLIVGDYDLDGFVGETDHALWKEQYGSSTTAFSGADGNGNGVVDAADYVVWRKAFQAGPAAANAVNGSVPEPPTCLLFVLMAATLSFKRLRHISFLSVL